MSLRVHILAGLVNDRAGSHHYHQELIHRLARRGHDVTVVCFGASEDVHQVATVHEVPRPGCRDWPFVWRYSSLLECLYYHRAVGRLPLAAGDVVIAGEHLFIKGYRRRFPHTPFLYLPHAPFVAHEINNSNLLPSMRAVTLAVYRHLQRWALRHADRTVRFTHQGCRLLSAEYRTASPEQFFVNPMGVDLPEDRDLQRVPGREVRLLCVGRLVPWKGIDTALAALATLQDYSWRFDVVGEGECRPQLEAQAKALGLESRVHFHGYQATLGPWYRQADLFLFPSRCEGLGLVMLDAMSHGVPCLAIRANGRDYVNVNEEVITSGVDGILADSEADFRVQLAALLAAPARLAALGRGAREKIAEGFTWDGHLSRYEQLFEELRQASRVRPHRHACEPQAM
jgi:glycosyltransferase involved in cell wall biosynthesis